MFKDKLITKLKQLKLFNKPKKPINYVKEKVVEPICFTCPQTNTKICCSCPLSEGHHLKPKIIEDKSKPKKDMKCQPTLRKVGTPAPSLNCKKTLYQLIPSLNECPHETPTKIPPGDWPCEEK